MISLRFRPHEHFIWISWTDETKQFQTGISCLEVSKEKNMIPAIILLPTAIVEQFSVDNNV